MENLIDGLSICDNCGGNAAYVQEINESIKITSCFGCGFQMNTLMKKGSEFFEQQIQVLPNLYKELMGEDEKGNIWMPSFTNDPKKGMVFIDGTSIKDWEWVGVKSVPVLEEEKHKYPIPGKKDQFYSKRVDMTTLKKFGQGGYMDALEYVGFFTPETV